MAAIGLNAMLGTSVHPRAWSRALTAVAAHGWTAEDLNQLLLYWERVGGGHWMPPVPYKPIGLVRKAIRWHEQDTGLDARPAVLILAQEAEERHRRETERKRPQAELAASRAAKLDTQRSGVTRPTRRRAKWLPTRPRGQRGSV